jgi:hypothetical protein
MRRSRTLPVGGLIMILVLALASLGVGYGLWFKTLTVEGIVRTGDVNAEFVTAFTDDDNKVDDAEFDSQDTGDCPISVNGKTSCDPAETGRDPKAHYDKDVSECFARLTDNDEQPGNQSAEIEITNGYPSYHCTGWFKIRNNGTVPVKIVGATINDQAVAIGEPRDFDLGGDEKADLSVQLSDIRICQQIEPLEEVWMDIDQHVLQPAPQGEKLNYTVKIQLNQWNETGCGVLLYYGNGGAGPDFEDGPTTDLYELKSHYEGLGYSVDYTDEWPDDLSAYQLIVIYGPGADDDSGVNFFDGDQVDDLTAYLAAGRRVVVMGDYGGRFGYATVNDLLDSLGVGIGQNADTATPDGDICEPMGEITADQVTTPPLLSDGTARLDPSATSSLNVSGGAASLARVGPEPIDCGGYGPIDYDATWMAIDRSLGDGGLVVIADLNILDDEVGFSDPQGDGYSGPFLANNLVGY